MSIESQAPRGANQKQPAKVHLVVNKLWLEQVLAEQTQELTAAMVREMRDGYSLRFPILACAGGTYPGVALVAEHDRRTQALRIDSAPGTTHLAVFLLFNDRAAWQAQVDKLVLLWPEQKDAPERTTDAAGNSSAFRVRKGSD